MDPATAIAGTVEGQPSKQAAAAESMRRCSANGGGHCELMFTFYNQCAAIAQKKGGGGNINWSTALKREQAEASALSRCQSATGCQIVYSKCSPPEWVR